VRARAAGGLANEVVVAVLATAFGLHRNEVEILVGSATGPSQDRRAGRHEDTVA
jgi:uncharacterized protein YggU (UPF0235/DUF167 family)